MTEKYIDNKFTTIKGILLPVEWDEQGNALAVAIMGTDEQEHIVEQNEKGKELLHLIRHEIEADGLVCQTDNGRNIIIIKYYTLKKRRIEN